MKKIKAVTIFCMIAWFKKKNFDLEKITVSNEFIRLLDIKSVSKINCRLHISNKEFGK